MSKSFIAGLVAGLTLLIVAGVGASKIYQRDSRKPEAQRAENAEYQAELPEATPVRLGILTTNQRSHSKLYANYIELTKNFSVRRAISEAKSKIVGIEVSVGLGELLT